jgi:ankyrin repeat protein
MKPREIQSTNNCRFFLAELYINSLTPLPTKGHVKDALRKLKKGAIGLNALYKDTMERIENQIPERREVAKQALAWIFYAKRPLMIAELQSALAVRLNSRSLDRDFIPKVELLRSLCIGLITIDEESRIVRLVHYTTQEYLQQTQGQWFPYGHVDIALTCLTYLSFDTLKARYPLSKLEFDERLSSNALYQYAITSWGHHAFEASLQAGEPGFQYPGHAIRTAMGIDRERYRVLRDNVVGFLNNEAVLSLANQVLSPTGRSFEWGDSGLMSPHGMTAVHLAAYFGLSGIVRILFDQGHPLDFEDSNGDTPLSLASAYGHLPVVHALVERRAAIDKHGKYSGTPLSQAAKNGHLLVVKALVEQGASLEQADHQTGRTPISLAAMEGHRTIVKALFKAGARFDTPDKYGQSPLLLAARNGHFGVVDILVRGGANINSNCSSDLSPFYCAADQGHEKIARYLLERGALVDLEHNEYDKTLLLMAASQGHAAIVELLLDLGAPINRKYHDFLDETAISMATWEGHEAVVKVLLARGAAIDLRNSEGETPLFQAALRGRESLVKLLLDSGAAPNLQDYGGRTTLIWAAANGHLEIVKTLLERRASIDLRDQGNRTALDYAKSMRREAITQFLIEKSVALN